MKILLGILAVSLSIIVSSGNDIGKVKITPNMPIIYSELGGRVSVDCSVTTQSNTDDLLWSPTTAINVGHKGTSEKKSNSNVWSHYSTLTIDNIKQENLGEYKCTFKDSTASFKLEAPIEDKQEANFTFGDTSATLSCSLPKVAKDIEKVEWLKNDTLVSKLSDNDRFTEDAENRTLTISKPSRDDADLYILRFTFKGDATPYDCKVAYRAAPFVIKFDKSKNLIEDDTMELQCRVKGYPRAVVEWLKDKKVLNTTDDNRVTMTPLHGFKNARLVIKNMKFDDAGDYTCKADSEWFNQSVSKDIVVRVKDKLAALWPFLGIVGEVVILCTIIFIYEKRRNKQAESESNNVQDVDGSAADKKEGLRHRNTSNNPTA